MKASQFHADIPGTPDYGAEIADAVCIANKVNMPGCGGNGSRVLPDRDDDRISFEVKNLAFLIFYLYAILIDLKECCIEIHRCFF